MKTTTLKGIVPFTRTINYWCNVEVYNKEERELNIQINRLISLYSVLGQSSQGNPENMEWKKVLEADVKILQKSIKHALGL